MAREGNSRVSDALSVRIEQSFKDFNFHYRFNSFKFN
jgi:hypothetical protein